MADAVGSRRGRRPGDAALLTDLLRRQLGGHDTTAPVVPAHLLDAAWRFVCECGLTWHARADAAVVDGVLAPPRQSCASCHQWVTGHRI